MSFLFVALGGALGAVARYAISLIPIKTEFPVLTLITNIIGAILIGFIVGITSSKEGISDNAVLFWKTGVCGGFTTFSTFSLEAFNLFDNNLDERLADKDNKAVKTQDCRVFRMFFRIAFTKNNDRRVNDFEKTLSYWRIYADVGI